MSGKSFTNCFGEEPCGATVRSTETVKILDFKGWCERGDLNSYPLRDWILSPARLPVPPLSPFVHPTDFTKKGNKINVHGAHLYESRLQEGCPPGL